MPQAADVAWIWLCRGCSVDLQWQLIQTLAWGTSICCRCSLKKNKNKNKKIKKSKQSYTNKSHFDLGLQKINVEGRDGVLETPFICRPYVELDKKVVSREFP